MPAVAWVTVIIAALIIAAAALGLLRVILHLAPSTDAGRPARRGARGGRQDHHRAHRRRLGQRQPQARPRLLRIDLRSATPHAHRPRRPPATPPSAGTSVRHRRDRRRWSVVALVCRSCSWPIDRRPRPAPINDALTDAVHNTSASGRAQDHDRLAPRPSSPGSSAAGSGWEADLAGTDRDAGGPVVGGGHRGVRRRAGRGRAADHPGAAGAPHRPTGRGRARHAAGRRRPTPPTRRLSPRPPPGSRPSSPRASSTTSSWAGSAGGALVTTLVVLSVVDIVLLIAGLAIYL